MSLFLKKKKTKKNRTDDVQWTCSIERVSTATGLRGKPERVCIEQRVFFFFFKT